MTDLTSLRREYKQNFIADKELTLDPLLLFQRWFDEALYSEVIEPNAMTLSTADPSGQPSARIVLLKGIEAGGFVFYTNYHSRKGRILAANNKAALTFFWPELERQVRVEGSIEKVSAEESDAYFASRPRGSQLGAWVSNQSESIEGREVLDEKLRQTEMNFADKPVMRPAHWGGFLLSPNLIEFWQGRPNRLHDRIEYTLSGEERVWKISRLAP